MPACGEVRDAPQTWRQGVDARRSSGRDPEVTEVLGEVLSQREGATLVGQRDGLGDRATGVIGVPGADELRAEMREGLQR
jgi:hypothetical protein